MNPKRAVIACGYPYGAQLLCTPVTSRGMEWFLWSAQGKLYPGMSGGPVIDLQSGKVIGSNTAVSRDYIILAPLISIQELLQIRIGI
jgi:hypothetical protein